VEVLVFQESSKEAKVESAGKKTLMKTYSLAIAATAALAQDRERGGRDHTATPFNSHDQLVTRDW